MQIIFREYAAAFIGITLAVVVAAIFRSGELRYTWRRVSDYAIAKAIGLSVLLGLLVFAPHKNTHSFALGYFVAYYATFIALSICSFRLYFQIYTRATVPFQGFAKWAKPLFALIVVIMVIMTLMTFGQVNAGTDMLARVGLNFMRAVNTVDFCVVACLCFLIRAMGMPWRGKVFGIMAGFALVDFAGILQMLMMQFNMHQSIAITSIINYSGVFSGLIWVGYAYLPEPLPRPVTLPAESPVYRWSQIASALGTKTQVAVPEPQHSFFLADVEKVVDKVFTRHMQETTDSAS